MFSRKKLYDKTMILAIVTRKYRGTRYLRMKINLASHGSALYLGWNQSELL